MQGLISRCTLPELRDTYPRAGVRQSLRKSEALDVYLQYLLRNDEAAWNAAKSEREITAKLVKLKDPASDEGVIKDIFDASPGLLMQACAPMTNPGWVNMASSSR